MDRYGVFGGTFNPVHYGHLRAALEVRQICRLDKVLWIPVCRPPHKGEPGLIDAAARAEMIKLAISEYPEFEMCDLEVRRGGKSYTVNTLKELPRHYPGVYPLFIVGADAFTEIATWYQYQRVLELVDIAVTTRPGFPMPALDRTLPAELAGQYRWDAAEKRYVSPRGRCVFPVSITHLDISSTLIRQNAAASTPNDFLTPPAVIEYIEDLGLYRSP